MLTDAQYDRYPQGHHDGSRSRQVARRTVPTGEALTAHVYVDRCGDAYGIEVRSPEGVGIDDAFFPYASERVAEAEARDLLDSYAEWWGRPE